MEDANMDDRQHAEARARIDVRIAKLNAKLKPLREKRWKLRAQIAALTCKREELGRRIERIEDTRDELRFESWDHTLYGCRYCGGQHYRSTKLHSDLHAEGFKQGKTSEELKAKWEGEQDPTLYPCTYCGRRHRRNGISTLSGLHQDGFKSGLTREQAMEGAWEEFSGGHSTINGKAESERIAKLHALAEHPYTPDNERAAARRKLFARTCEAKRSTNPQPGSPSRLQIPRHCSEACISPITSGCSPVLALAFDQSTKLFEMKRAEPQGKLKALVAELNTRRGMRTR